MKQYKSDIENNEKVEFIHASLDSDEDSAEKWAAQEQFPWLTVLHKDFKRSGLDKFSPKGVPHYILVDRNGEQVAVGKSGSFNKIKELTAKADTKEE